MNPLANLWASYRTRRREQHGAAREITSFLIALFCGVVLLPPAIWLAGQWMLGPYVREVIVPGTKVTDAGPIALWTDFLVGLLTGSLGHWCIALGPYVIYVIWRLSAGIKSGA